MRNLMMVLGLMLAPAWADEPYKEYTPVEHFEPHVSVMRN